MITACVPTVEQAEAFQELVDFLRENPEKHDQRCWISAPDAFAHNIWKENATPITREHAFSCGTVGCLAGWKAMLDDVPVFAGCGSGYVVDPAYVNSPDERAHHAVSVEDYAADKFGLPKLGSWEHPHPFGPQNTIKDLHVWANLAWQSAVTQQDLFELAEAHKDSFSWDWDAYAC